MKQGNGKDHNRDQEETMPKAQPAKEKESVEAKEKKEDKDRMTVYVSKSVAKQIKHLAIDEEKDFSYLAEQAFTEFLKNRQRFKS